MREAQLKELIDRHFEGGLDKASTRVMYDALREAPEMKRYFKAKRAWATLDPNAIAFELRLSRFVGRLRRVTRRVWLWSAAPVMGLAALVVVLAQPKPPPEAFFSRAAEGHFWATAYAGGPDDLELGDDVSVHDALRFTYQTDTPGYLAIFAVDEDNHVHWFEPVVVPNKRPPTLAPVTATNQPVRLSSTARPLLKPGHLRLFVVLVDAPLTTAQIESSLPKNALQETELRFARVGWTRVVEVR